MASVSSVACPHCQGSVQNDGSLSGQQVVCPHCNRQFTMPPVSRPVVPAGKPPVRHVQPTLPNDADQSQAEDQFAFIAEAERQRKMQAVRSRHERKPTRVTGKKEVRATCNACGHVWHYLPGERRQEFGHRMSAAGQGISKAGCAMGPCCCLSAFMPSPQKVSTLTTRCPKCNSASISRATVVH